jgi:hypothetical protein
VHALLPQAPRVLVPRLQTLRRLQCRSHCLPDGS